MILKQQQPYADPAHEAYIANVEKEVEGYATIKGKQHGRQNKPKTEQEWKASPYNFVQAKIQIAIDYNQQVYLPVSGVAIAQQIRKQAADQKQKIQSSLDENEHQLHSLESEIEKIPSGQPPKKQILAHGALGVLAITEGVLSYPGFRNGGFPGIASFFAALSVSIAVFISGFYGAQYIKNAANASVSRVRQGIILVVFFAGFLAIGMLRANAYNDEPPTIVGTGEISQAPPSASASGLLIAIVSFLLFWIALFVSIRFVTTNVRSQQSQFRDKLLAQIKILKADIHKKEQQMAVIDNEAMANAFIAIEKFEYALAVEKRLQAIAIVTMELYKDQNLRYRTDGFCPSFFSYPPAFRFNLFFNTDKYRNHENPVGEHVPYHT